jgi:hypothetical protein
MESSAENVDMRFLFITQDFFNNIPMPRSNNILINFNDVFEKVHRSDMTRSLTDKGKKLFDIKNLIPHFLNNQTKYYFKQHIENPKSAPKLSLSDIIKLYNNQNTKNMCLYFKTSKNNKF